LPRSCWYYRERTVPPRRIEDERLMRRIDARYTRCPFYGVVRMSAWLRRAGEDVNVKRVRRLMRLMGLEAIHPRPRTSVKDPVNTVYPYLLRDLKIVRRDQVWCTDITYIPLVRGWAYLVAVMDGFSRFVLSWEVSSTLDAGFCVDALVRSMSLGVPEIFNSDQGSQFTSEAFTGVLKEAGVRISMAGRGRAYDNILIERLWRSVKYEDVYMRDYGTPAEARSGLERYFAFYNFARPHQALDWQTPGEVYGATPTGEQSAWLKKEHDVGCERNQDAAASPLALRARCEAAASPG
jgi:putative transposase